MKTCRVRLFVTVSVCLSRVCVRARLGKPRDAYVSIA